MNTDHQRPALPEGGSKGRDSILGRFPPNMATMELGPDKGVSWKPEKCPDMLELIPW